MKNSPVLTILARLPENEWPPLREYLASSFSGISRLGWELFALLDENRSDWIELENEKAGGFLNRENLYEKLYPGEKYVDQRIRRVFMELQNAFKSYLVFRASRQGHWLALEAEFMRYLLDCGAYPLFKKAFDKAMRRLQHSPPVDDQLQSLLSRIRGMENEYLIHTGASNDSFDKLETALDRQYLARKLENWTSMRTREKRYPQQHQFSFRPEVESMVEAAPVEAWPEVQVWKLVFQLESATAGREDYLALEKCIREQGGILPLGKLRQVRGYMYNFLVRHLRSDRREDYRELWLLAKTMLEEGTLHLKGRLSAPFLSAAVQTACVAGEATWAANFLSNHGEDLVGPEREQVLALHHLMTAYHLGDYRAVLRGSAILRYGNPRYDLQLRVLQLKSHYDLEQGEDFLRLTESFRKLISRKKGLGKRFTDAYTLFGRFAERLGRQRFVLMERSPELAQEIRESGTTEKLWLLEKAGE